ncbi:MAG: 6-bladed beta-propeller [Gemmatimonadota bacterium]
MLTRTVEFTGVLLLLGCGEPEPRYPPRESQRTEVAEPIVVTNPADGSWQAGEAWRVVEELRIGAVSGTAANVFGDVADVEVDAAGRLFVVDRLAREVRVFGPEGRHIRNIGRAGPGPGEFRQPTGIVFHPDGTLWVADLSGNGYSVFDTTGTFIRAYSSVGFEALPWRGAFDRAGRFYETDARVLDDGTPGGLLVAYTLGETLVPADSVSLPVPVLDEIELPRGTTLRTPFGTESHWTLDPRGHLWVGRDDRYRIVQITLSGDTVRVVEKEHEPAPVTPAEAEAERERLAPTLERMMGGGTVPHIDLPEHRPAYETFMTDDRGNLWVGLTLTEDRRYDLDLPARYDVFDAEGRYLGEVMAPIAAWKWGTKPTFRDDYMAGVVTDELGVDYVVRARVVRRP